MTTPKKMNKAGRFYTKARTAVPITTEIIADASEAYMDNLPEFARPGGVPEDDSGVAVGCAAEVGRPLTVGENEGIGFERLKPVPPEVPDVPEFEPELPVVLDVLGLAAVDVAVLVFTLLLLPSPDPPFSGSSGTSGTSGLSGLSPFSTVTSTPRL
jgi:hypothetical protein